MSSKKTSITSDLPLMEGDAAILLEESIILKNDGELQEAEKKLHRIIVSPYQWTLDMGVCDKALALLCMLYRQRGAYKEIIECCSRFLEKVPNHINAYYFLGASYQVLGENELGLEQYTKVLELDPEHAAAYLNSGILFQRKKMFKQAIYHFKRAVEFDPENVDVHFNLGAIQHNQGNFEAAMASYKRVLELAPDNAYVCYMLADICEMTNSLSEAEQYLQQGISLSPGHPLSYRLVATLLRRQGRIDDAISRLEEAPVPSGDLQIDEAVHFEFGRLYERKQDSARAYAHYQAGNRLLSQRPGADHNDKDSYLNMVRQIRQTYTPDWLATWTPPFETADQLMSPPTFLVGFPRSGTTLLDQILSSHSGIQVIEEQVMIANIRRELAPTPAGYLSALADLQPSRIQVLRQQYMDNAAHYLEEGKGGGIIDKLPLNIVHIGLIVRLFPDARIILALRHPCDVCLSCFMQAFGANDAMANFYTLEDAARLYAEVMGLWRHYTNLLPLKYHQVRYEDIVENFEGETRKLLGFLDLKWEPGVLEYNRHAGKRKHINTPSYNQVTEKIYTRARYRWQRYEDQLRPVAPMLSPFIDYFGY